MTTNRNLNPHKDFWLEHFSTETEAVSIMIGEVPALYIDGKYNAIQDGEPVTRERYYHELEKVLSAGEWDAFLEGEEITSTHYEDETRYRLTFNNGYRATAKIIRFIDGKPA
jgi:hypothetical protein